MCAGEEEKISQAKHSPHVGLLVPRDSILPPQLLQTSQPSHRSAIRTGTAQSRRERTSSAKHFPRDLSQRPLPGLKAHHCEHQSHHCSGKLLLRYTGTNTQARKTLGEGGLPEGGLETHPPTKVTPSLQSTRAKSDQGAPAPTPALPYDAATCHVGHGGEFAGEGLHFVQDTAAHRHHPPFILTISWRCPSRPQLLETIGRTGIISQEGPQRQPP